MKRPPFPLRWLVCGLFGVTSSATLGAAEEIATGPVVELPKFVVTDSRELPQPESWRYATVPGFEILTNASDKATRRLMSDFDLFRQALSYVWPVPDRPGRSATLIICGKGGKFDRFVPKGDNGPEVARATLLLRRAERSSIVIDFQATTLNVLNVDSSNDAATGTDSGMIQIEHDKQLYREYVHYLLSRSEPRLPAWFEEGLAQIIMKMRFDRRSIEFARLEEANTISAQAAQVMELNAMLGADGDTSIQLPGAPAEDTDFNAALRRRRLVPLEKFFAVKHDAPEALNPLGNNIWAKQAYAFVHLGLYGFRGKYQKKFTTFLGRAAKEPVTEAMFKECWGMSYKDMLIELRGYADSPVYESKLLTAKTDVLIPAPPLELRDATPAEVGRIKGEALLMAGHKAAAKAELIAPYTRGERDPNLLGELGLFEKAEGEDARARKFLEAAVAGKATRADTYLELARFRYADAIAKPEAEGGRLSPAQTTAITALLYPARRQPPHLPALYDLLGDTWTRSAAPPSKEDVGALIDGVRLFPGRLKLLFQTSALAAGAGMIEAAHSLAEYGIKVAPSSEVKARFDALKKSFPPEPPAPVNSGSASKAPAK
jgi:hypothetical protein